MILVLCVWHTNGIVSRGGMPSTQHLHCLQTDDVEYQEIFFSMDYVLWAFLSMEC